MKTYIVKSRKDQGCFRADEIIRTVTLEDHEDPSYLAEGLAYEVSISQLSPMKDPGIESVPVTHSIEIKTSVSVEKPRHYRPRYSFK